VIYLASIYLNPRSRHVRRDVADCREMHRTVLRAFPRAPEGTAPGDAFGVLYRVEQESRGRNRMLVQSSAPDEMRGRVSAVSSFFSGTSNYLGQFESGVTCAWFGTVPAVVIGGLGSLPGAALGGFVLGAIIDGLIVDCVKRLGSTAVAITHDMASARRLGDAAAMIHGGRIIWNGPASALLESGNPIVDQFTHGRREGPIQMELRA